MSGQDNTNDNLTDKNKQLDQVEKIVARAIIQQDNKKTVKQLDLMENLIVSLNKYETLMNKIKEDFNTDETNPGAVILAIQGIIQKLNFNPNFYQVSDGKDHTVEDFKAITDSDFKNAIKFMDNNYMTFYEIYDKLNKAI